MNIIGGGVANLTGIPVRRHTDLQNLTNNDHPWYSAEPNRIALTVFTQGLDAAKSATPAVGNIYYATDTVKLYECFATNVWTQVSDIAIPAGAAQGDIIYFDGAKWNRLAAGTSGFVLQTQGASANPQWVNANPTKQFSVTSNQNVSATEDSAFHTCFTSGSIPAITAGQTMLIKFAFNRSAGTFYGTGNTLYRVAVGGTALASTSVASGGGNVTWTGELFITCPTTSSQIGTIIATLSAASSSTSVGTVSSAINLGSSFTITFDAEGTSGAGNAQTWTLAYAHCYIFN